MLIKVITYIEAPDDATTHYTGWLERDHTFWKQKDIAGFPQWLYFSSLRNEWMVQGDSQPHFMKEIERA